MAEDLEVRRRRAGYRAHHRGTKEMDILLGRYADAKLGEFTEAQLSRFEEFLLQPDPRLQAFIFGAEPFDGYEFADMIIAVRTFHGVAGSDAAGR